MRVLDLFSGIGGFSLGLERAGMTTVQFCEIDPFCRNILAKHWPEVPCHDDITTFSAIPGSADVVCGGWPCQTHSTAARGRNVHPDMWPDFFRIIEAVRPRWVVAENVPRALDGWPRIRSDLEGAGYEVGAQVADTALPERQRARVRAIIVAHANRNGQPRLSLHEEAPGLSQTPGRIREPVPRAMGVADGVPSRMDRLRVLGNSIVPAVAEMIGRAIMKAEHP